MLQAPRTINIAFIRIQKLVDNVLGEGQRNYSISTLVAIVPTVGHFKGAISPPFYNVPQKRRGDVCAGVAFFVKSILVVIVSKSPNPFPTKPLTSHARSAWFCFFVKSNLVDLPRIELGTVQCECTGMPLTYRPSLIALCGRGAGNRTRSLRTRSARTTGILRPGRRRQSKIRQRPASAHYHNTIYNREPRNFPWRPVYAPTFSLTR